MGLKDKPGSLPMPIDNRKYPDNWKKIALSVKESANWRCSCCGKRCYKPGEIPEDLTRSQWSANILQVHHRNHDPSENESWNLQCVCATCHLNLHRSKYSAFSPGQLSLF